MTRSSLRLIATAFAIQAIALQAFASIPHRQPKELDLGLASIFASYGKGADYSMILPVEPEPTISSSDVARYIPQNMATTNSQGEVAAQIVDRGMNVFLQSNEFRNSSLGHATHSIEKKMQQDIAIGGQEPDSTKHEFKFQMRAANAKALMDYKGFFNAEVSYTAANQTADVEVYEDLTQSTKLVYGHMAQPGDTRNTLNLRWLF